MQRMFRAVCRRGVCIAGALAIAGCDRPPPPNPPAETGLSPRQTVEKLIALRRAGRFEEMGPLIVEPEGANVVRLLVAADEFIAANRQLGAYVRANIGESAAEAIDCGSVADNLDIFSLFVTPLDERIEGEAARVSFMVEDRLPARETRLRRVGGVWRYDPGAASGRQAAEAIAAMAQGLRSVLQKLETGQIDVAAARGDPKLLLEEVRTRLAAGARMLPSTRPATNAGG